MTPLLTQSLTLSTVGPGAMSGSDVPASTLIASWFASRTVVRWTLMPVLSWNGFRTSWNALSSAPPQAVQTVTSVEDAPPEVDEPPQATTKVNNMPSARARLLAPSFRKPSAITDLLLVRNLRQGAGVAIPDAFFPGSSPGRECAGMQGYSIEQGGVARRAFA